MKSLLHTLLIFVFGASSLILAPGYGFSDTEEVKPKESKVVVSERFYVISPRRIAVLPFENLINESGGESEEEYLSVDAEIVRKIFYGHFSPLGYHDIELNDIDNALKENGINSASDLKKIAPNRLGKILDADALIYGYITGFDVTYALLYSQISMGFSMMMVSTKTGEVLWRVDDIKRDHSFKVGLDPLSIFSGLIQTAAHLNKKNVIKVVENLSRDIVETIPKAVKEKRKVAYKAWFDSNGGACQKAGDVIKVYFKGKTGLKAVFHIDYVVKDVPMQEKDTGFYEGTYRLEKGRNAKNPRIIIHCGEKKGNEESLVLTTDLLFDTTPPPAPHKTTLKNFSDEFLLRWKYPEVKDFESFKVYKKDRAGRYTLLFKTTDRSCMLNKKTEDVKSYVLTAVDQCGNESKGIEIILKPKKNQR